MVPIDSYSTPGQVTLWNTQNAILIFAGLLAFQVLALTVQGPASLYQKDLRASASSRGMLHE